MHCFALLNSNCFEITMLPDFLRMPLQENTIDALPEHHLEF